MVRVLPLTKKLNLRNISYVSTPAYGRMGHQIFGLMYFCSEWYQWRMCGYKTDPVLLHLNKKACLEDVEGFFCFFVLLYGNIAWKVTPTVTQKLQAFVNTSLRHMMTLKRRDLAIKTHL